MTPAESARTAVWLIAILAIIVAVTFKLTRRDLTITRAAALVTPVTTSYQPTGLLPHLDGILIYLGNYSFEDPGPRWGAAAQPSPALASMLKLGSDNKASGTLIPNKRSVWHLLNEIYVTEDETVPGEMYRTFGKSIFLSERLQQAGLCDYIDKRIMPGLTEYLARGNYGEARRLVSDMMGWVGALDPSPRLAGDNPRLQAYVNFFLRLDALLNDPITLYAKPVEGGRLVDYVSKGEAVGPETVAFLKEQHGELAAWGAYLAGQAALRRRDFSAAAHEFDAASHDTANSRLKDLSYLSQARSLFWGAKTGAFTSNAVASKLAAVKSEIRSSFRSDIDYYQEELRKRS